MSVIVAGGAGFIGVNFVKNIFKYDQEIYIIDNFSSGSKQWINLLNLESKVNIFNCELSNLDETKIVFEEIFKSLKTEPKIWHFAANSDIPSGVENPKIDFRDTFLTTFNLLQISKIFNICSFYFASSSAVYGDHGNKLIKEDTGPLMPISNYGAMKLASEAACFSCAESFLEDLRIYRFPNVVGMPATHGVILDFINKLNKDPHQLEVLGNGTQRKSYLHVDDLVDGMIYLSERDLDIGQNPIFNLGPNNDFVTVSWIAERTIEIISSKAKIIYGEGDRGWIGDVPKFVYDTSKAKDSGWKPSLNSEQSIIKAINEIAKYHKK